MRVFCNTYSLGTRPLAYHSSLTQKKAASQKAATSTTTTNNEERRIEDIVEIQYYWGG